MNTTPARQSIANLRGEIEFRAKLAAQHVTGEILLPDYYNKNEHNRILQDRLDATHKRMQELASLGFPFSPFLELGAERGQRSLVLTNDFGADGIAIDISWHQLRTMEHFSGIFNRNTLPMRICCDANHLPFRTNAFPFAFCYEFLHHFPAVAPIMKEIHRVVSGYFYFDEEPFRRVLKLVLYQRKHKIYSEKALRKNKYLSLIESFVSEAPCDEVEHGIIENDDLSVGEWMHALSIFEQRDVHLLSLNRFKSKLAGRLAFSNVPNFLLGGTIAGLCRKKAISPCPNPVNLPDLLGCPECILPMDNGGFDRPPLVEIAGEFQCVQCSARYPRREGVILLLPPSELQELYPAF
jgi:SAM-dependent methyltransferase